MTPKLVVRTDSLFEAALGLVLVSGWLGPDDFPSPVGKPLIIVVGIALIAVGALLWRLADKIDLRTLAFANLGTAAAAIVWRVAAASGFSDAGAALVTTTAAGLILLAAAQLKANAELDEEEAAAAASSEPFGRE
jgi:hypothetical protein